MVLSRLNAKGVNVGIKNGMTRLDFCNKYQCSEAEFEERIHQIYSKNARQAKKYLDAIRSNEKIARRDTANMDDETETIESVLFAKEVLQNEVQSMNEKLRDEAFQSRVQHFPTECFQKDSEDSSSEVQPSIASSDTELEQLEATEATQRQELDEIIAAHRELAASHYGLIRMMRKIDTELKGLASKYKSACSRFESVVAEDNDVIQKMNTLSVQYGQKAEELESTRKAIAELKVITLCVDATGEITTLDDRKIVLDESGSDEMYQTLIQKNECQELRLKDIRILARLLSVVSHLKAEHKLEYLFDNEDLEVVFQLLQ